MSPPAALSKEGRKVLPRASSARSEALIAHAADPTHPARPKDLRSAPSAPHATRIVQQSTRPSGAGMNSSPLPSSITRVVRGSRCPARRISRDYVGVMIGESTSFHGRREAMNTADIPSLRKRDMVDGSMSWHCTG
jgi:hypothetical protein